MLSLVDSLGGNLTLFVSLKIRSNLRNFETSVDIKLALLETFSKEF